MLPRGQHFIYMSNEQLGVSPEFQQAFQKVYPYAYGDGEAKLKFTSLLRETVETGNLNELKYMVYSLREIGTHASINPSGQMADFQKWLPKDNRDQYKIMLSTFLRPEHLPDFDTKALLSEASRDEVDSRQKLDDILFACLYLTGETAESRKAITASALALLESNKSDVEIRSDQPGLTQLLLAQLAVNNQADRKLLPIWTALLYGNEFTPQNRVQEKLLKQNISIGFHGIMSLPTKEGCWWQIPLDVAPLALQEYVKRLDQRPDDDSEKDLLAFNLDSYYDEDPEGFTELLRKADFQNWPAWAKLKFI